MRPNILNLIKAIFDQFDYSSPVKGEILEFLFFLTSEIIEMFLFPLSLLLYVGFFGYFFCRYHYGSTRPFWYTNYFEELILSMVRKSYFYPWSLNFSVCYPKVIFFSYVKVIQLCVNYTKVTFLFFLLHKNHFDLL